MKNYIDEKGNYVNCENLSLREIYERGKEDGKKEQLLELDKRMTECRCVPFSEKKQFL